MRFNPVYLTSLSVTALLSLTFSGCSTAPALVRQGDQVELTFTCRLPGGEVAASTNSEIGEGDGLKRSSIFLAPKSGKPVPLVAGTPQALPPDNLRSLEDEILQQLGAKVVGMKQGERRTLELLPQRNPSYDISRNRLTMAAVRNRPKEARLSLEDFKARTGKDPVIGASFPSDSTLSARVTAVSEKEVAIGYTGTPGSAVPLFFGAGVLADAGDHYEIRISAEKGKLVRSGPVVGRVVDVNERLITMEFPDPFAGERLICDVSLISVAPGKPGSAVGPDGQGPGGTGATAPRQDREAGKAPGSLAGKPDASKDVSPLRAALQEVL